MATYIMNNKEVILFSVHVIGVALVVYFATGLFDYGIHKLVDFLAKAAKARRQSKEA